MMKRRSILSKLLACGLALTGPCAVAQSTIQPSDRAELQRVFRTTADFANDLQDTATPTSVQSMRKFVDSNLPPVPASYVELWHLISLDVTSLDHAPQPLDTPMSYHEQFGPTRTSRALALVHLAMFEVANLTARRPYESIVYRTDTAPALSSPLSESAAIVEVAYETLHWLYPGLDTQRIEGGGLSGKPCANIDSKTRFSLRVLHECLLEQIGSSESREAVQGGRELGLRVAADMQRQRRGDGSALPEPSWGNDFIALQSQETNARRQYPLTQWQKDPVSQLNIALGGRWSAVQPFVLASSAQYRPTLEASKLDRLDPTDVSSWPSYRLLHKYAGEKRLNSRSSDDVPGATDLSYIAKWWAYDGTAGLCAPSRLYNQIATAIYQNKLAKTSAYRSTVEQARFYALVNLALADAGIAAWDSKYYFQFARPVTAIRGDQQAKNAAIPAGKPVPPKDLEVWFPLGAQVSNSQGGINITPPFPSYPSGHAVFGGALFGILRQFDTDGKFAFLSDEFNKKNRDAYNFIRCKDGDVSNPKFCAKRDLTFDCAERENADSRVWMGVHWSFDANDGIDMGNKVAYYVYNNALRPVARTENADRPLASFQTRETGRQALTAACGTTVPDDAWVASRTIGSR